MVCAPRRKVAPPLTRKSCTPEGYTRRAHYELGELYRVSAARRAPDACNPVTIYPKVFCPRGVLRLLCISCPISVSGAPLAPASGACCVLNLAGGNPFVYKSCDTTFLRAFMGLPPMQPATFVFQVRASQECRAARFSKLFSGGAKTSLYLYYYLYILFFLFLT